LVCNAVSAQTIDQTNQTIVGNWELDIQKTREIYRLMADFMTESRKNEVEGMLSVLEIYNWNINSDGTTSVTYKMKDGEQVTQETEWSLQMTEFQEREINLRESVIYFKNWKGRDSWVSIKVGNDGMFVMSSTNDELVIFDVGSPLVFNKTD